MNAVRLTNELGALYSTLSCLIRLHTDDREFRSTWQLINTSHKQLLDSHKTKPPHTSDVDRSTWEIITPCFVGQKSKLIPNFDEYHRWILRNSRYIASNRSNYARMFAFLTATVYSVVREPSLRFPSAAMRSFSWNIHNSFPSPAPPYFRRTYSRATWHQRQWY